MRKRRNFRKKPKDTAQGLSVTVFNNNIEEALSTINKAIKLMPTNYVYKLLKADLLKDIKKFMLERKLF